MTIWQFLNYFFAVLGISGAIVGIFSILIRVIRKSVRDEMKSMEADLLEKLKQGTIGDAAHR